MKKISGLTSLLLALAMVLGLAGITATTASAAINPWPSLSEWAYAEGYCLTNDTPVYTTSTLAKRGSAMPYKEGNATILATHLIYIYSMNSSYAYVSYPDGAGGRSRGYIRTIELTPNNAADFRATAKGSSTVYTRPWGAAWSSFAAGDYVIGFATSGKYTQCFFTSRSGYRSMRLGWVLTSDFNRSVKGVTPTTTTTTTTKPTTLTTKSTTTTKQGNNPVGYLDSAAGGNGTVTITGWAFDWDKVTASLGIHVYVGGEIGKGEGHGDGVANKLRPDVNAVYDGAGNYHGFSHTVRTSKRGQQAVYVYAMNASGTPGANVLIGKATVNISSAGYTVTYDANGGSGAPASQAKAEGKTIKLSSALPTNSGKIFKEWNTKKDGTGDKYMPGADYKADANVTLYAQWSTTLVGDINGDGKVDITDLWLLMWHLNGSR